MPQTPDCLCCSTFANYKCINICKLQMHQSTPPLVYVFRWRAYVSSCLWCFGPWPGEGDQGGWDEFGLDLLETTPQPNATGHWDGKRREGNRIKCTPPLATSLVNRIWRLILKKNGRHTSKPLSTCKFQGPPLAKIYYLVPFGKQCGPCSRL